MKLDVRLLNPSPPGSHHGWWMDVCAKHGETSFNSIVDGCEQCARERLANDEATNSKKA